MTCRKTKNASDYSHAGFIKKLVKMGRTIDTAHFVVPYAFKFCQLNLKDRNEICSSSKPSSPPFLNCRNLSSNSYGIRHTKWVRQINSSGESPKNRCIKGRGGGNLLFFTSGHTCCYCTPIKDWRVKTVFSSVEPRE